MNRFLVAPALLSLSLALGCAPKAPANAPTSGCAHPCEKHCDKECEKKHHGECDKECEKKHHGECDKECEKKHHGEGHGVAVKMMTIADVAELSAAKKVTVIDVNGAETRKQHGVIPGATLLSGAEFPLTELPADKATPLVFYCGSVKCGASHKAAQRAAANGWTNVAVLPDGIKGWVDAGKPTSKN